MKKSLSKEVIVATIPIIFSGLLIALSGIITTVIFSQLGAIAVSAVALISSVMNVFITLAIGLTMPLPSLVSHRLASCNDQQVKHLFMNELILTVLFGVVPFYLMRHSFIILVWLGQPIESAIVASHYFIILSYGLFPMLATFVIAQLLLGLQKFNISFIFTSLACLINLVFMLILTKKHGVMGAAYATNLSYIIVLSIEVIYLFATPEFSHLNLFRGSLQVNYVRSIVRLGLPLTIQRVMEVLALAVIMFFMGVLGKNVLAAQHIIMQLIFMLLIIPMGFMQAASIFIGKAAGSNNYILIRAYARRVNYISLVFILVTILITWCSRKYILNLFAQSEYLTLLLKMALITLVFDSIRYVLTGILRGIEDVKFPMIYSAIGIWLVGVPVSYLLAFSLQLGVMGLVVGWISGIAVVTLLLLMRYYKILFSRYAGELSFS